MSITSLSSLNYDVLVQICAFVNETPLKVTGRIKQPLDSLSKTSRLFHELCFPGLHREIVIECDIHAALKRLERSEDRQAFFAKYVRILTFKIRDEMGPSIWLASALARLTSKMIRLQKLVFWVPDIHTYVFAFASRTFKVLLPDLTTLAAGPNCGFLIAHCPNVSSISTYGCHPKHPYHRPGFDSLDLFEAAQEATKLSHVILKKYWTPTLDDLALAALPNLISLELERGEFLCCRSFFTFLEYLSRLPKLQHLTIDGIRVLNCGSPTCVTVEETASLVIPIYMRLKTLWIPPSAKFEIERDQLHGRARYRRVS